MMILFKEMLITNSSFHINIKLLHTFYQKATKINIVRQLKNNRQYIQRNQIEGKKRKQMLINLAWSFKIRMVIVN